MQNANGEEEELQSATLLNGEIGDIFTLFKEGILFLEQIKILDVTNLVELIIRFSEPIAIGIITNYLYDRLKQSRSAILKINGKTVEIDPIAIQKALQKILEKRPELYKRPISGYSANLFKLRISQKVAGGSDEKQALVQSIVNRIAISPRLPDKPTPFKTLFSISKDAVYASSPIFKIITLEFLNKLLQHSGNSSHWALLALKEICNLSAIIDKNSESVKFVENIMMPVSNQANHLKDLAYSTVFTISRLGVNKKLNIPSVQSLEQLISMIVELEEDNKFDAFAALRDLSSSETAAKLSLSIEYLKGMFFVGHRWNFDPVIGEELLFSLVNPPNIPDAEMDFLEALYPNIINMANDIFTKHPMRTHLEKYTFSTDLCIKMERDLRNDRVEQYHDNRYPETLVNYFKLFERDTDQETE